MDVKSVVNVMNFHALLRVDKSRKSADRYGAMEKELADMMRLILNNRNLKLDKHIKLPNDNLPILRIYIGSDFGFCGAVNTSVSAVLMDDTYNDKIVIGKKVRKPDDVLLYMDYEELEYRYNEIEEYLKVAVTETRWSGVELVYNHYYNISTIRQITRRIYPLYVDEEHEEEIKDDFIIEGDPGQLLEEMIVNYLICEMKIAVHSAYASENVLRENVTSESLKKIDEMEKEKQRVERKNKNAISFKKTIDRFMTQKALRKD